MTSRRCCASLPFKLSRTLTGAQTDQISPLSSSIMGCSAHSRLLPNSIISVSRFSAASPVSGPEKARMTSGLRYSSKSCSRSSA